jgi:hypothetical protein
VTERCFHCRVGVRPYLAEHFGPGYDTPIEVVLNGTLATVLTGVSEVSVEEDQAEFDVRWGPIGFHERLVCAEMIIGTRSG